jgi:cobalamin synthase
LIPIATLVLVLFPPVPLDGRTLLMFVGSAVTAMFTMNGVALWVTLLAPRRGDYNASFGNDLSFAANVVVIGGIMSLLFVPRGLAKVWPDAVGPGSWWMVIPLIILAVAFYFMSLRRAEQSFVTRRERLLGIFEGRD